MADRGEGRHDHGDEGARALVAEGVTPDAILDFAVNVSPEGPSEAVISAIRAADLHRYPDPYGLRAKEALAQALCRPRPEVALGHGAAELIFTSLLALTERGDRIGIAEPTFGVPRKAAVRLGRVPLPIWMAADDAFEAPAETLIDTFRGCRLVYLCRPNNPTGKSLPLDALRSIVAACPKTLFVLDEAFLALSERHAERSVDLGDRVIRIRSLTKDHALPGLRVAYALAAPPIVSAIESHRAPWTISAPALSAIEAIASGGIERASSRERMLADRRELAVALAPHVRSVVQSETVFVLAEVADAPSLCRELAERHRIVLRDGSSFGLPRHVRIAARPKNDRERLIEALAEVDT